MKHHASFVNRHADDFIHIWTKSRQLHQLFPHKERDPAFRPCAPQPGQHLRTKHHIAHPIQFENGDIGRCLWLARQTAKTRQPKKRFAKPPESLWVVNATEQVPGNKSGKRFQRAPLLF